MQPQKPKRKRDFAIIDVETTGLKPVKDGKPHAEIIDICIWRVDADTMGVVNKLQFYIQPQRPALAFEVDSDVEGAKSAAEINGFDVELWKLRGAIPLEDAMRHVAVFIMGCELMGQNVKFDEAFLTTAFEVCERPPTWSYHSTDLKSLALPMCLEGACEGRSLKDIAKALGVEHENAHSAEGDVATTYACMVELLLRYRAVWGPLQ